MAESSSEGYRVEPFRRERQLIVDIGQQMKKGHRMYTFIEVDVTKARRHIRRHKAKTGKRLSFTSFIIFCLARAVDENRSVQARRRGGKELVVFDDVDVNNIIEAEVGGVKMPVPHIIRGANRKSHREIHDEMRKAQADPIDERTHKYLNIFARAPGFIRRYYYRKVRRDPAVCKKYLGTVAVTAVGMFDEGNSWWMGAGTFQTLSIIIGGIGKRRVLVKEGTEVHEYLSLTISFDHDIVDGAPAARFIGRLRKLIESGYGLGK